jgi:hypothetical protein
MKKNEIKITVERLKDGGTKVTVALDGNSNVIEVLSALEMAQRQCYQAVSTASKKCGITTEKQLNKWLIGKNYNQIIENQ